MVRRPWLSILVLLLSTGAALAAGNELVLQQSAEGGLVQVPAEPEYQLSPAMPAATASPETIRRTDFSRRHPRSGDGRRRVPLRQRDQRQSERTGYRTARSWQRDLSSRLSDRAWSSPKRRARCGKSGHASWISPAGGSHRCNALQEPLGR